MTTTVSAALRAGTDDPFKVLALAVIASAVRAHDVPDQLWLDLAEVDRQWLERWQAWR